MRWPLIVWSVLPWILAAAPATADKVHLKNGTVETGKLRSPLDDETCKNPGSAREAMAWCCGKSNFQLWDRGQGVCLKASDIVSVERHIAPAPAIAQKAREDRWAPFKEAFALQLVPVSATFSLGQPMRFALLIKNVSGRLRWFDAQDYEAPRDVLEILDARGRRATYKSEPPQTTGNASPIDAGEILAAFESRDVAADYVIARPGDYRIRVVGVPGSEIAFRVTDGAPAERDEFLSRLQEGLPGEAWTLSSGCAFTLMSPNIECASIRQKGDGEKAAPIIAIKTIRGGRVPANEGLVPVALGHDAAHDYYVIAPASAESRWHGFTRDLARALRLPAAK